jgi:hypothetical protein
MALTASTQGSLHPGGNPLTISKYVSNNNTDMYTCPAGRICYVSDGEMLIIKDTSAQLPIDHRGGLTTDQNHKPFYVTQGVTVTSTGSGARFIGVEFDV